MARRFKFCVNCRRTITDTEMRRGLYVEGPQGILCATCARQLDETPETPTPETPVSETLPKPVAPPPERDVPPPVSRTSEKHLEGIREMVESIHRALLFEKTSSWNIAGSVAQCMAVGMLLIAAMQWLDKEGTLLPALLVAIVFQLMALTFFVKAK